MTEISPALQARINGVASDNKQTGYQPKVDMTQQPDTFELSTKKDNKKKIGKYVAIGLAITAAAAGVVYAVKKGKSVKLNDIKFDKGVASLQDGSKFTGKIKDTLKNGDKILLEYKDGVIQKSTRSGSKSVQKIYDSINGEKIVKQTIDGVPKEPVNITKVQNEAKEAQNQLKEILQNKNLSSKELKQQTDKIKYKSKTQKEEIEKLVNKKQQAEEKIRQYKNTHKDISEIKFKKDENGVIRPYSYDETAPKKLRESLFSNGEIYVTMPNGDKVTLEYDGYKLKKSTRSGKINFTKEYGRGWDKRGVDITKDGKTEFVDITKKQEETKARKKILDKIKTIKTLDDTKINSNNGEYYTITTRNNGRTATVCCDSDSVMPTNRDNLPKYYKSADDITSCDCLHISKIIGNGKGSGTKGIKQAVQMSNDFGYGGKIMLDAEIIDPSKGTPVPFYAKLGFKATDKANQKMIEEAMAEYAKTGVYNGPRCCHMFLPEEAINKFLTT